MPIGSRADGRRKRVRGAPGNYAAVERKAATTAAGAGIRPAAPRLTRRELEIVDALVRGCSNKEMAVEFGVSVQTVKNQLSTLFRRVGARGRVELVVWAMTRRRA